MTDILGIDIFVVISVYKPTDPKMLFWFLLAICPLLFRLFVVSLKLSFFIPF